MPIEYTTAMHLKKLRAARRELRSGRLGLSAAIRETFRTSAFLVTLDHPLSRFFGFPVNLEGMDEAGVKHLIHLVRSEGQYHWLVSPSIAKTIRALEEAFGPYLNKREIRLKATDLFTLLQLKTGFSRAKVERMSFEPTMALPLLRQPVSALISSVFVSFESLPVAGHYDFQLALAYIVVAAHAYLAAGKREGKCFDQVGMITQVYAESGPPLIEYENRSFNTGFIHYLLDQLRLVEYSGREKKYPFFAMFDLLLKKIDQQFLLQAFFQGDLEGLKIAVNGIHGQDIFGQLMELCDGGEWGRAITLLEQGEIINTGRVGVN